MGCRVRFVIWAFTGLVRNADVEVVERPELTESRSIERTSP
jgi:hypothetical protein